MTSYWSADANSDIMLMVAQAMQNWHKDLNQHNIRVGVVFALGSDPDKPVVKSSGYPAIANVRLIKGKDRAFKSHEVEILVDASIWRKLNSESKLAVVDHELAHVAIKKKKVKKKKNETSPSEQADDKPPEEEVVLDDRGRPVLRLKKGDWNVGDGFKDVVSRHGQNAVEYSNIKSAEQMVNEAMAS